MSALTIKEAIEAMPNGVIPEVNVTLGTDNLFSVTFASKRNIGVQSLIQVESASCTDNGCQPFTQGLTATVAMGFTGTMYSTVASSIDALAEFETCSDRGVCDRNSGRCQCEPGYHGLACDSQNEIH